MTYWLSLPTGRFSPFMWIHSHFHLISISCDNRTAKSLYYAMNSGTKKSSLSAVLPTFRVRRRALHLLVSSRGIVPLRLLNSNAHTYAKLVLRSCSIVNQQNILHSSIHGYQTSFVSMAAWVPLGIIKTADNPGLCRSSAESLDLF